MWCLSAGILTSRSFWARSIRYWPSWYVKSIWVRLASRATLMSLNAMRSLLSHKPAKMFSSLIISCVVLLNIQSCMKWHSPHQMKRNSSLLIMNAATVKTAFPHYIARLKIYFSVNHAVHSTTNLNSWPLMNFNRSAK